MRKVRGLVRSDVNVIMFDEPLTVIDPHLKWELRSKLTELHHRIRHRLFISLLGSAFICLAWLGIVGSPLWAPVGIAILYAIAVFRWV